MQLPTTHQFPRRSCRAALALLTAAFAIVLHAQETRGMIFGRVLDPTGSAVVGAQVTVTNVDTRATVRLATNDTG